MEAKSRIAGWAIRVVALFSLALGLLDAARLLGLFSGDTSPIAVLGPTGFACTGAFALALLFASVGLWIRTSWGAVLLVGAVAIQLTLHLLGNSVVSMSLVEMIVRLLLLVAVLLIVVAGVRLRHLAATD